MSASTAIGMVGESLKDFLEDRMNLPPLNIRVSLLAPDEPHAQQPRINLFLYKVQENTFLRNKEWEVSRSDPGRITPPPLSLNLFYLLTPYAQNDPQNDNTAAHEILGEAMRVFHQEAVVPDEFLTSGLQDAREQLRIIPGQLDLDELSQVWSTFGEPFRLSVPYEISVVQLDQLPAAEQVMAQRVTTIGAPEVRAPFTLPSVDQMTPGSGPAGSTITFSGEGLEGWRAYVTMARQSIGVGSDITGNSFTVTVPGDLPRGFHEIRVDISRLFRRTFFFEVTA